LIFCLLYYFFFLSRRGKISKKRQSSFDSVSHHASFIPVLSPASSLTLHDFFFRTCFFYSFTARPAPFFAHTPARYVIVCMESRVWHPASLFFVLSLRTTVLCILNPIPSTENLNLTPSYAIPKRGGHSPYVLSLDSSSFGLRRRCRRLEVDVVTVGMKLRGWLWVGLWAGLGRGWVG